MITSQGVSLTFGGTYIGRLTDIDGEFTTTLKEIQPLTAEAVDEAGRYLSLYRKSSCDHRMNVSTITTSFDTSTVGGTGQLVASGAGWSICFPFAVLESLKFTAKVGDYLRVNYTFRRTY